MSLIEKIDEMKARAKKLIVNSPADRLDEIANDISEGYITACDEIRDYILSEKKEPCYSKDDCEMKENGKCTLDGPCPHLTIPTTIGDKIRESNESLADYIIDRYYCIKMCPNTKDIRMKCKYFKECKNDVLKNLNQPATN